MGTGPGTAAAAPESRTVTAKSCGRAQSASRAGSVSGPRQHRTAVQGAGVGLGGREVTERWRRGQPMPRWRWAVWMGTRERHPARFVESTSPRDTCQAGAPFAALRSLQLRRDLLRDGSFITTTGIFLTKMNPCRAAATCHSIPSLLSVLPSQKQTHMDVAPSHFPALVHSCTKHISPLATAPGPHSAGSPGKGCAATPSATNSSGANQTALRERHEAIGCCAGAAHTGRFQPMGSCTGTVRR